MRPVIEFLPEKVWSHLYFTDVSCPFADSSTFHTPTYEAWTLTANERVYMHGRRSPCQADPQVDVRNPITNGCTRQAVSLHPRRPKVTSRQGPIGNWSMTFKQDMEEVSQSPDVFSRKTRGGGGIRYSITLASKKEAENIPREVY